MVDGVAEFIIFATSYDVIYLREIGSIEVFVPSAGRVGSTGLGYVTRQNVRVLRL